MLELLKIEDLKKIFYTIWNLLALTQRSFQSRSARHHFSGVSINSIHLQSNLFDTSNPLKSSLPYRFFSSKMKSKKNEISKKLTDLANDGT